MRRTLAALALLVSLGCGNDKNDLPVALTVDAQLTLGASLGGDIGVAIDIDDCSVIEGPANAIAKDRTLATLESPEPLIFASGKRFIINIPGAALDPGVFGLPAQVTVEIDAVCDGERVKTSPYTFTYVPTTRALKTAPGVTRFWPSDVVGELLVCDGNDLVRYDGAGTELSRLDLNFSCALADIRGDVGERRFIVVDAGGMAAIDPGPVLVWARHSISGSPLPEDRFVFDAAWTRPDQDIVVQYKQVAGGVPLVALVSRDTGLNISPTLPLVHRALGAVSRDPNGNLAVLTAEKVSVENVYYIELFDTAGVQLRAPVEASRYPAGTPYAEFSFDGDRLYVQADDGNQNRWVQSVTVADGAVTQLSQAADGWRNVVGEAYFRLLVASDDQFIWLDRDSGSPLSAPFGPDSGNSFYRLRVETDGTTVMLADPSGAASAAGFYVFRLDGSEVIRLHGDDQSYGWMVTGWDGGSLVSIQDASAGEVQVVPTGAEYLSLAD